MKDLRSDGDRIAELAAGDLTAPVPTCPGWTLGDLVRHVGEVHRWQTAAVRDAPDGFPAADTWQVAPKPGQSVAAWFEVGLDEAIAVMSAADPSTPRWTWAGMSTAAWYLRRITNETLVHRLDAELAAGISADALTADVDLAADGIDEMCDMFMPASIGRAIGGSGESVRLSSTDTGIGWLITLHPDRANGARASSGGDAVICGRTLDLLFMAWGREPLRPVEITGDDAAVDVFRAAAKL